MTVWYVLLAFVVILGATSLLYWFLTASLEREDARILGDNLSNARLLIRASRLLTLPSETALTDRESPSQVYLRVVDGTGRVLVETSGLSNEVAAPSAAELARTTSNGVNRRVLSRSGKVFQTLTARVPAESSIEPAQFIEIAIDRENEEHVLTQYRERMWFVLGLSLVLCSIVGYGVARGGMRPIRNISHTAERIGPTTLFERIATRGLPAELVMLAEIFNHMLGRLQTSFARVSQFSDDVAHELRTPIGNLRGEMEVALSKTRSNEDYREVLGSCLEECARISRVIEGLLFLARAENSSEPLRRERVEVGKELTTIRDFYEAAAAEAGVDLRVSVSPGLSACVDPALFQQAIGNLVSNAISHTPPKGTVHVGARAGPSLLDISVIDTGCGIAPEHLPYVFDRFYRVDRARSGACQNVGLGLAIVKSIVARHGGRIEINSEVGRGTAVTLLLPR